MFPWNIEPLQPRKHELLSPGTGCGCIVGALEQQRLYSWNDFVIIGKNIQINKSVTLNN